MAGIKETPTNFRVYYTSMREAYTQKNDEAIKLRRALIAKRDDLYFDVKSELDNNKSNHDIKLNNYPEFVNNKYIDGELLRTAKGHLINKSGNYELIASRSNLYELAKTQKEIYLLDKNIELYEKLLNLTVAEYTDLLKTYYNKVHEKMIVDGYGYVFGERIGWTCINRCHVKKTKQRIDYKLTKENKARLLAEGKRLYNKEEAEWCLANGVEYDGVDGRVYQNIDYVYEIPLIGCTLKYGDNQKLTISNYIGRKLRGKSNKEILEECNYDKLKVCQLDLDIRAKLDLCLEIDKILYTKFIRNENQEPSISAKTNRKSR